MDAIKDIPQVEKPLQTESGPAKLQKTDIFRKLMWFSYNNDNDWHSITCDRVREIQAINELGIKVFNLQVDKSTDMEDLAAQSTRELELLDKKFAKKKKKKKTKNRPQGESQTPDAATKAVQQVKQGPPKPQAPRPQQSKPQNRQNVSSVNPPQPKVQDASAPVRPESKEGNEARKKKNKNRNRPKPAPNQGSGPKPENQPNKPAEGKQEGNRKFPPRRNQGPNNGGNE